MHKIFSLITFIIATISYVEAAQLQPRPLKVCAVSWPPFIVINDRKFGGIDTDILTKSLNKLGFTEIKIDEVPWKRCLKMAEDGDYDIVYSASKCPEREKFLLFPQTPLHKLNYVFVTKNDAKEEWSTKQDVSSLPQPISIPFGYSLTDKLKKEEGIKLDNQCRDDLSNLNKLSLGRVGTIVIESDNCKDLLNKLKLKDKVKILTPPYSDAKEYYITVSKKAKDAQAITEGLDRVLPEILAESKH